MRDSEYGAPPVAIVGTGRSGSGYISKVLTAAGFLCGHEEWWNPGAQRRVGMLADSSWCALAWDLSHQQVWYQIRNPFDVIASFTKRWSHEDQWWPMKTEIFLTEPAESDIDLAMQVVAEYHTRAMMWDPEHVWQLETITPELIDHLVGCGLPKAQSALASVPTNYNYHGPGSRQLGPDDLPDNRWKADVLDIATTFGYL